VTAEKEEEVVHMFRLSIISRFAWWFTFVLWVGGAVVLLPPDWFAQKLGLLEVRNENRWIGGPATLFAFVAWNYQWVRSLLSTLRRRQADDELTLSEEEARKPPKVNVIGPCVGLGEKDNVRIVIGVPHMPAR